MKFDFNISNSTTFRYQDPINITNLFDLGIFLKLPKNFFELVKNNKIKIQKFDDLIKDRGHKWLSPILGAPWLGPLQEFENRYERRKKGNIFNDIYNNDIEEAWILGGTFKDRESLLKSNPTIINRGIVNNKFIYDLETPYLDDEHLLPWKNIIPGFLKSKELGWIGWAYVNTDPEKKNNSKFLITWNNHRIDTCYNELRKKIKKFFTITGVSYRWLMGASLIDREWEQFLREYDVYVCGKYERKIK